MHFNFWSLFCLILFSFLASFLLFCSSFSLSTNYRSIMILNCCYEMLFGLRVWIWIEVFWLDWQFKMSWNASLWYQIKRVRWMIVSNDEETWVILLMWCFGLKQSSQIVCIFRFFLTNMIVHPLNDMFTLNWEKEIDLIISHRLFKTYNSTDKSNFSWRHKLFIDLFCCSYCKINSS
jgi:hypothetical protein